jgi:carbon monoxide dehydrogenase subunit G
MGLRFEHSFVVRAPRDRVWSYLTDPYRVAPALPGASITEKVDDRTYAGGITVKVGPVSAKYRGTLRFEALDAALGRAEIVASGQDTSGRGGADMRMTSTVTERAPGETEVAVVSEVNVTGMLAQFGRGLMQDVSDQMFQRFTEAVRAELEKPGAEEGASPAAVEPAAAAAAPPVELVSFGTRLAGRAAGRAARQPLFWVAAAAVVLALFWLLSG